MRYRFKSTKFQSTEGNGVTAGEDSDNSRESADRQWQEREERRKEGGGGDIPMNKRTTRYPIIRSFINDVIFFLNWKA